MFCSALFAGRVLEGGKEKVKRQGRVGKSIVAGLSLS